MSKFHQGIAIVVLFSSFAATSLASAHDTQDDSQVAHAQTVGPLETCTEEYSQHDDCNDFANTCSIHEIESDAYGITSQCNVDAFDRPDLMALATYQQCENACKAGIVAIEAFCRVVPDPRVRAACWAARFSTPVCIGFCKWYFT